MSLPRLDGLGMCVAFVYAKRTITHVDPSRIRLATAMAIMLAVPIYLPGQTVQATGLKLGGLNGTVTDVNGDTVPKATVVLQGPESNDRRPVVTGENGFFQFGKINPGTPYQIKISAKDFANWTSPTITLEPGQFKIVTDIQLRLPEENTKDQVNYNPMEVATEELKAEEKQRIFGIVPNFSAFYEKNPEPLTTKMKFELALKTASDPVTIAGVGLVSAARQAANSPNYGQGWGAYGHRVGANEADSFTDIMIAGAILPSLLHQDPRYFYQGTGTTGSRIKHAIFSTFVTRGDNGNSEPNYSTIGGDLGSAALSNVYYPESNRGAGLVFSNFAINRAARIGVNLAQEFILDKFTRKDGHNGKISDKQALGQESEIQRPQAGA